MSTAIDPQQMIDAAKFRAGELRRAASEATTTLPSVLAAERFLRGEPGGLMAVVSSTAGRAGIIFMGLYLAGERTHTLKYALAGALAIETFVLVRIKAQLEKAEAAAREAEARARAAAATAGEYVSQPIALLKPPPMR